MVSEEIQKEMLSPKQRAFLAAFGALGSITDSSRAAKVNITTHYQWLKDSEEYRKAFALAERQAGDTLEGEAYKRATRGVERLVTYKGKPVFYNGRPLVEHQYSDGLVSALLKGLKPERYKDKIDINNMGSIEMKSSDLSKLRDHMLNIVAELPQESQLKLARKLLESDTDGIQE